MRRMLACLNVNNGIVNLTMIHLNGEEGFYKQYSTQHTEDTQMLIQPKVHERKIHFVLENGDVYEIDYTNNTANCNINIRR